MDFGNLLTKVLPWIGAAATGNVPALIAMAAREVSDALGVEVQATPEAIGNAVAGATPEQIMVMKDRDLAFQERMQAMGFAQIKDMATLALEETKTFVADQADARARDVKFLAAGTRNYRADLMFLLAVGVIAGMVWIVWKDPSINEYVKGIFTLVLGRFLGYLDNIFNFEFGSTRSSKTKDATIENLSR